MELEKLITLTNLGHRVMMVFMIGFCLTVFLGWNSHMDKTFVQPPGAPCLVGWQHQSMNSCVAQPETWVFLFNMAADLFKAHTT